MIGTTIGNYRIIERIGEGGIGEVYKAVDTTLDREVAIKALRPEFSHRADIVERFQAEAKTLARLNHPNIATLYNLIRDGDRFFMAIELVRGETFDTIIRRSGRLAPREAVKLFLQALHGIACAHGMGVVHRDIKPGNLMLTDAGVVKVMDFGIARVLGRERMTRAGSIVGTLEYMPPEQIRGEDVDSRSDVYSLGIVLYEMLTGRVPFVSETEYDLIKMQVEAKPKAVRDLVAGIPVEMDEAVQRCLRKKPKDRFQKVEDLEGALRKLTFEQTATPKATVVRAAIGVERTGRTVVGLLVKCKSAFGKLPWKEYPGVTISVTLVMVAGLLVLAARWQSAGGHVPIVETQKQEAPIGPETGSGEYRQASRGSDKPREIWIEEPKNNSAAKGARRSNDEAKTNEVKKDRVTEGDKKWIIRR